jgi:penicillin amidase
MRAYVKRLLRWLGFSLAALLVVAIIGGLAGWRWMLAALPPQHAEIKLAGISKPIAIHRREVDGIPIISAKDEYDAFFALGWVHAEDRLWQMDFERRVASGRLSEILGARTLDIDRLMRTLGLKRVAEANLAQVSTAGRALLEAYAAGVNAWIEHHRGPMPPEFLLLGYRPEPWQPVDSVLWGRLMALQLSDNYRSELARARIASVLNPKEMARLFPPDTGSGPTSLDSAALASVTRLAATLPSLSAIPGLTEGAASNAWVLGGSRTQSGKPILANDPHLGFSAPSLWYLARIETPTLTLAGATAAGVPAVLIGHNGQIGWGFTTTQADTQDVFVERLVDADHYASPQGPLPFVTRTERIGVKGADAVEITVRQTRHGPVLSDISPEAAAIAGSGYVVALAWPALRDDDASVEAVLQMNRARNWAEFKQALRKFHSPQQNVFYADREGHIGMIAPARVPIRASGDGRMPVEGWSGAHDWTGFIPFEHLPQSLDPESGRIVNANNRIVPASYPYLIAAEWEAPYRAQSIAEALDHGHGNTVEGSGTLQQSTLSVAARELLPFMSAFEPKDDRQREALRLLHNWDFEMRPDRPEPLIFDAWLLALTQAIFADELGSSFDDFLGWRAETVERTLAGDTAWCDDRRTPAMETCADQLSLSLSQALDEITNRLGPKMAEWRWGEVHPAHFAHPVFTSVALLDRIFDRRIEIGGDYYTAGRAVPRIRGESRYTAIHGAGVRVVLDLSDLDRSLFNLGPGESGNPLSSHYDDLLISWRNGRPETIVKPEEGVPMRTTVLLPLEGE